MLRVYTIFALIGVFFLSACSRSYTPEDIERANYLASKKIIQDWSNDPEKYRLTETPSRSEIVDIGLLMVGIRKNEKCRGDFTDVPNMPDSELCRTMETGADYGFINTETKLARSTDVSTRAEALAILMNAVPDGGMWSGYGHYYESNFPFEGGSTGYRGAYIFGAEWQAQIFYDYIRRVLRDDSQLKVQPWPMVIATRSDVFEFAYNILKQFPTKK